MNDKMILSNYLSILKSNVEVYVHGTIESSNKNIKDVLCNLLNETLDMQADTFDIMLQNKMYEISNVKMEEIKKVYQKICK